MTISRRDTLKLSGLLPAAALPSVAWGVPARAPAPVALHWLEGAPSMDLGQTFGAAWPRGALPRSTSFAMNTAIPVQSWVTATWPDGSIKWTAHALPDPRRGARWFAGRPSARPWRPPKAWCRTHCQWRPRHLRRRGLGFRQFRPRPDPLGQHRGQAVLGPLSLVGAMADGPEAPARPSPAPSPA
jgi:hypothetical protein